MPIDASPSGTLDIENATLRSREIVALTNMVAGNDVVRSDGPALEVYGDPGPRLELVSNTAATDGTATFTRLESNVGVFSIQSGVDAATNGPITFGGFQNERMRITADGKVGVGKNNPGGTLDVNDYLIVRTDGIVRGKNSLRAESTADHSNARYYPVNDEFPDHTLSLLYQNTRSTGTGPGINFSGSYHDTEEYMTTYGTIKCAAGGLTNGVVGHDANFRFYLNDLTNTGVREVFTIMGNTGNVGIGTDNPGSLLNFYKDYPVPSTGSEPATDYTQGIIFSSDLKSYSGINWNNDDGVINTARIWFQPTSYSDVDSASAGVHGKLNFGVGYNNNGGTTDARTPKITITSEGRVGIGSTKPEDTLDVRPNMKVTGGSSNSYLYLRSYGSISRTYNGTSGAGIHFTGAAVFPANYNGDPTQGIAFGGSNPYRWGQIYSTSSSISTSDRNQKRDIIDLTQTERRVANRIRNLIKNFKFNDAYEKKGDDARIHTGVIAQEIEEAFTAEGLDASRYGLFCKDDLYVVNGNDKIYDDDGEWTGQFVNADTPGAYVQSTEYSVRYEELLAFVVSNLASLEDIERLETKNETLEARIMALESA